MEWPWRWLAAAALIVPPLTLALSSRLRDGPGQKPNFVAAYAVPSFVLAAAFPWLGIPDGRALGDYAAWAVAALTVLVIALAPLRDRGQGWSRAQVSAGIALLLTLYLAGAVRMLDIVLDTSEPAVYRAVVTVKPEGRSSESYRHRPILLAPWGPDRSYGQVLVPQGLYDVVHPGSVVCVYMHQGYLGLRWYEVDAC